MWALLCPCYPFKNVNLPYPLFEVILLVILYNIIIKITLEASQIIALNSHFGSFTSFYVFKSSYI